MANKTAMQELIDHIQSALDLNKNHNDELSEERRLVYITVIDHAKNLLVKERQQIKLADLDGQDSMDLQPTPNDETYYETTYP